MWFIESCIILGFVRVTLAIYRLSLKQSLILFMHFVGLDSEQRSVLMSWLCFMMPEVSAEEKAQGLNHLKAHSPVRLAIDAGLVGGLSSSYDPLTVASPHQSGLSHSMASGLPAQASRESKSRASYAVCYHVSRRPALYFCRILQRGSHSVLVRFTWKERISRSWWRGTTY